MSKQRLMEVAAVATLSAQPLIAAAHHEGESLIAGGGILIAAIALVAMAGVRLVRQRHG